MQGTAAHAVATPPQQEHGSSTLAGAPILFVTIVTKDVGDGRRSNEALLDSIDAVVWEAHPYP